MNAYEHMLESFDDKLKFPMGRYTLSDMQLAINGIKRKVEAGTILICEVDEVTDDDM